MFKLISLGFMMYLETMQDNHDPVLRWHPVSEIEPQLGGPLFLVASGRTIQFARWAYGCSYNEEIDCSKPLWVESDGTEALDPQPDVYLPLILPDGTPWPEILETSL